MVVFWMGGSDEIRQFGHAGNGPYAIPCLFTPHLGGIRAGLHTYELRSGRISGHEVHDTVSQVEDLPALHTQCRRQMVHCQRVGLGLLLRVVVSCHQGVELLQDACVTQDGGRILASASGEYADLVSFFLQQVEYFYGTGEWYGDIRMFHLYLGSTVSDAFVDPGDVFRFPVFH